MNSADRFNIYTGIHKGLRAFMCDVLIQVGCLDPDDAGEIRSAAAAVRALLEFARGHLQHEDEWIHPALEARRPGSSKESQADHRQHRETFAQLETSLRVLERSEGGERNAAALGLYRQLALFVAENFEHMHIEETENHATLVACYSEQEVLELNQRLVAAVSPGMMATALRWMVPSISAQERASLLGGMRANAPRPVFEGVIALVRPHLSGRDWAKLGAAIGPLSPPAIAASPAANSAASSAASVKQRDEALAG
jgi:hypothetical protein